MNNTNTDFIHFNVFDFTGSPSLTSYTLPNTPLTFVVNISSLQGYTNDQILWSFGDNTYSTSLTGVHVYEKPGVYTATCWLYDFDGNGYISIYSTDIIIRDFIVDHVCFTVDSNITLTSGRVDTPILIERYNSQRHPENPKIGVGSSGGSKSFFEQDLETNKYGHLLPYSTFYQLVTGDNSEFVEVDYINTRNNTTLFCVISNNTITICPSSVPNSIFCGTTGFDYVYYKDDTPSETSNLYCWFDRENEGLNTSVCVISCEVTQNNDLDKLSITSTGIDGEGTETDIYHIDITKFVNEKIYFTVKIKDSQWYSVKWPSIYTLSTTFSCFIVNSDGSILPSIVDNNFTIVNIASTGGYFKGFIIPKDTSISARISAVGNIEGNIISGVSNTFTVHPSTGTFSIAKKNENFDWTQTMKDLCFQEVLIDSTVLFNDFIGTIFGNVSSSPVDVGKLPWEKISNFLDNNQSIDYCNIDKLYSICTALGYDLKDQRANINYPAQIKRLIDLFSIKYERLVGDVNVFDENFDRKTNHDLDLYGTNIGNEIDVNTYILTGGDNFIVAQEKFSGQLIKCNTFLLSSGVTYPLSTYSPSWGWNLVLGYNIEGVDIGRYYTFYEYVSGNNGEVLNSIFDYTNPLHDSSFKYSEWVTPGGGIENMLIYQFLTNTNIISSY